MDIVILDMRKVVNFCDYFVICSGNTDRMVRAIADSIADELEVVGLKYASKIRAQASDWMVFDAGDVVAHIFQKKTREFYNIEHLWQEAPATPWED